MKFLFTHENHVKGGSISLTACLASLLSLAN